jgi:hypothetical protein
MITRWTTLVLGAGASIPFGFPSGQELLNFVVSRLDPVSAPWLATLHALGFDRNQVFSFRTALKFSGRNSVDKFLARRPDLVDIGKAAITLALAPHEIPDRLFEPSRDAVNWYKYLFDKMDTDWQDFSSNKLAVITFNYDRSLEHFLFTALKHSHNKSDEECASLLSRLPIVHVHGQLGFLPWQGSQPVKDYTQDTPGNTGEIADTIKIISETTDDTPEFQRAQSILADSERIYFLGFGYDQTNLRRLGFGKMRHIPGREILGTALHMNDKEVRDVANRTGGLIRFPVNALDTLGFLRNYADLT